MTEKQKICIDPVLLELLCCPACKSDSKLQLLEGSESLSCSQCQREYTLNKVAGPEGQGKFIPNLILQDS